MSSPTSIHHTVISYSSGTPNRSLNKARTHHFVIDGASSDGGPEALSAPEAFLSGVSACAVNLLFRAAQRIGIPLQGSEVVIEGVRDPHDIDHVPAHFEGVDMRFTLWGPTSEQADVLIAEYQHT